MRKPLATGAFALATVATLCAISTVILTSVEAAPKVKIGAYVESLCPDSRRFILDQLIPAANELDGIMDVNIVPFGKARTLGQGKMICQHGARECDGNRLQACVLAYGKSQLERDATIGCLFRGQESARDCVSKYLKGVTYEQVEKCKTSEESYRLMELAEKKTGKLGYVPHLTYNDESSEDIQQQMETNLKGFICDKYTGTKPEACKNLAAE